MSTPASSESSIVVCSFFFLFSTTFLSGLESPTKSELFAKPFFHTLQSSQTWDSCQHVLSTKEEQNVWDYRWYILWVFFSCVCVCVATFCHTKHNSETCPVVAGVMVRDTCLPILAGSSVHDYGLVLSNFHPFLSAQYWHWVVRGHTDTTHLHHPNPFTAWPRKMSRPQCTPYAVLTLWMWVVKGHTGRFPGPTVYTICSGLKDFGAVGRCTFGFAVEGKWLVQAYTWQ